MTLNEDVALAMKWAKCDCRRKDAIGREIEPHWKTPKGYCWTKRDMHIDWQPPDYEHDLVASDTLLEVMRTEGFDMWEIRYASGTTVLKWRTREGSDAWTWEILRGNINENRCRAFLATRGGGNE